MLPSPINDQAAGLRRMLGKTQVHKYVILSAIPTSQKNTLLLNLASSFIHTGSFAHLLDTRIDEGGISARTQQCQKLDLWDLAFKDQPLHRGFYEYVQGGRISKLSNEPTQQMFDTQSRIQKLSSMIQDLSTDSNIWLIDTEFGLDNPFLIPEFSDSEIILLVSNTSHSIKKGYSYIKHVCHMIGRRNVALMVVNADESQAQLVHKNMSSAAKQYLSMNIKYLGAIPPDDHLARATQLGQAIIDAFPLSKASTAFRAVVNQLLGNPATNMIAPPMSNLNHLILEH
jgi:flagellar biosynthesis protein FlhG